MPEPITILVVEDNDGDYGLLTAHLEEASPVPFELVRATSLRAARALLDEATFEAVILDLNLGDSQGLETYRRLHAFAPGLPVIVLSGVHDLGVYTEAIQAGARDCLLKGDLSPLALGRALRSVIDRHVEVDSDAGLFLEELRRLDEIDFGGPIDWHSRAFGVGRLRNTVPGRFEQLVDRYTRILRAEGEHIESRDGRHHLNKDLQQLAIELGFLDAEPRDIVEMHIEACRAAADDPLDHAFIRRSRFKLLELMGHTAAVYLAGKRERRRKSLTQGADSR